MYMLEKIYEIYESKKRNMPTINVEVLRVIRKIKSEKRFRYQLIPKQSNKVTTIAHIIPLKGM